MTEVDPPPRRRVWTVPAVLLAVVVLLVIAVAALARPVAGVSMRPTLADGDRVLVDPFRDIADLRRFDLVAYRSPGSSALAVKRVIAVAGDRVTIDAGAAYVLPAGSAGWLRLTAASWTSWGEHGVCCDPDGRAGPVPAVAEVPSGAVFVLGDNPAASVDSRVNGWVTESQVAGRVVLRVWPLGDIGGLSSPVSVIRRRATGWRGINGEFIARKRIVGRAPSA